MWGGIFILRFKKQPLLSKSFFLTYKTWLPDNTLLTWHSKNHIQTYKLAWSTKQQSCKKTLSHMVKYIKYPTHFVVSKTIVILGILSTNHMICLLKQWTTRLFQCGQWDIKCRHQHHTVLSGPLHTFHLKQIEFFSTTIVSKGCLECSEHQNCLLKFDCFVWLGLIWYLEGRRDSWWDFFQIITT